MASVRKLGYGRKGVHVETEGAIVNIYEGLTDRRGRKVNTIEIIPDESADEPRWRVYGSHYSRVVQLKNRKQKLKKYL